MKEYEKLDTHPYIHIERERDAHIYTFQKGCSWQQTDNAEGRHSPGASLLLNIAIHVSDRRVLYLLCHQRVNEEGWWEMVSPSKKDKRFSFGASPLSALKKIISSAEDSMRYSDEHQA